MRSTVFARTFSGRPDPNRSEVEDCPQTRRDHLVAHSLGGVGGGRDDADLDVALRDDFREAFLVFDQQPGRGGVADSGRIGVENCDHQEVAGGKARVVAKGVAEVAGTDDCDPVFAVETEDLDDVLAEFADVVAHAANAELAEIGEILADLGRIEVESRGEVLAGDRLDPEFEELVHAPEIDRKTGDRQFRDVRRVDVSLVGRHVLPHQRENGARGGIEDGTRVGSEDEDAEGGDSRHCRDGKRWLKPRFPLGQRFHVQSVDYPKIVESAKQTS